MNKQSQTKQDKVTTADVKRDVNNAPIIRAAELKQSAGILSALCYNLAAGKCDAVILKLLKQSKDGKADASGVKAAFPGLDKSTISCLQFIAARKPADIFKAWAAKCTNATRQTTINPSGLKAAVVAHEGGDDKVGAQGKGEKRATLRDAIAGALGKMGEGEIESIPTALYDVLVDFEFFAIEADADADAS